MKREFLVLVYKWNTDSVAKLDMVSKLDIEESGHLARFNAAQNEIYNFVHSYVDQDYFFLNALLLLF